MITSLHQIQEIKSEADLLKLFKAFEESCLADLKPLRDTLARMPLSNEVPKLEIHMAFVESWRDRVAKRRAIATCFLEHAKSHHFLLEKTKSVTSDDRMAYQKSLTAAMSAMQLDLEDLIDSIDSRVNEVKKLLGTEYDVGGRRLHA